MDKGTLQKCSREKSSDRHRDTTIWTTQLQVPRRLCGWRVSHETSLSAAAHWWTRWGELRPARCRSRRMTSPGSLPSNWPFWSSPSSSPRQDWSVMQLSVKRWRQKETKEELSLRTWLCVTADMLFSGCLTQGREAQREGWRSSDRRRKDTGRCLFIWTCSDLFHWGETNFKYHII